MRTLITGASAGLGEGMARELAARGHDLALVARRLDRLEALRDELAPTGVRIVVATLDVDDHDAVFTTFRAIRDELGGLDRVIVNAGVGKGAPIGTGRFDVNLATARTNFVAALAQCEAAMEHFYERNAGHLVVISSVSAMRGMPGSITAYAATKAGVAHVAEGIRSDLLKHKGHDIKVTTLFPGYIASEMNEGVEQEIRMMVDTETGCKAMVKAIEKEVVDSAIPPWPWSPLSQFMKHAPLSVLRRMM